MKKPVVDYRKLRPSNITSPEFRHLLLLLGWVVYFALYILTENLIPPENCHTVHSVIDDIIPFCEVFVIPYVFWYALIVFSLLWFALYNTKNFVALQKYIITTQLVAMAIYIIYPTKQELRPAIDCLPDNFFGSIIELLYTVDTPTGVCPSLHVAYSLGIASVWTKEKGAHPLWKAFVAVVVILICLSTMFIKQHSAVDFFAALPVCLLAEFIALWKTYYKPKLCKKKA